MFWNVCKIIFPNFFVQQNINLIYLGQIFTNLIQKRQPVIPGNQLAREIQFKSVRSPTNAKIFFSNFLPLHFFIDNFFLIFLELSETYTTKILQNRSKFFFCSEFDNIFFCIWSPTLRIFWNQKPYLATFEFGEGGICMSLTRNNPIW